MRITPAGARSTYVADILGTHTPIFDANGRLYICDYAAGRVLTAPPGGGSLAQVGRNFAAPAGLAFDRNGDLIVGMINERAVFRLTTAGADTRLLNYDAPESAAVGEDGVLTFVGVVENQVKRFHVTPTSDTNIHGRGNVPPRPPG